MTGERLIHLVPHRFLHGLPLHLTLGPDGTPAPRGRVSVLPSASLLGVLPSGPLPPDGRTIVGGNPTGDLTAAATECSDVAARFTTTAALGPEVTLAWLSEQLAGSGPLRLVHLACHALFDPLRPERSGLVLANGTVTLPELTGLELDDALVVISACSSGRSHVRDGDELASLTRTLLAAGARALLVTLWPVPDNPTAELVSRFYDRLDPGRPWSAVELAGALSGAQDDLRQCQPASDWGGFVFISGFAVHRPAAAHACWTCVISAGLGARA